MITDPNLAGASGTAVNVSSSGSVINVAYLQAALLKKWLTPSCCVRCWVAHERQRRFGAGVPQTFYYPTGTFSSLTGFLPVLLALEGAFVGAYMTGVEELLRWQPGTTALAPLRPIRP